MLLGSMIVHKGEQLGQGTERDAMPLTGRKLYGVLYVACGILLLYRYLNGQTKVLSTWPSLAL